MAKDPPKWWPPKVGDKLRHATQHGTNHGTGIKQVSALLRVKAVFEDEDGEMRIVTSEWFPTRRRWNYEVFWWYQAALGAIWPDGEEKPSE
jgi:hypothetical protein